MKTIHNIGLHGHEFVTEINVEDEFVIRFKTKHNTSSGKLQAFVSTLKRNADGLFAHRISVGEPNAGDFACTLLYEKGPPTKAALESLHLRALEQREAVIRMVREHYAKQEALSGY